MQDRKEVKEVVADEGLGYFLTCYADSDHMPDPELKSAFLRAQKALQHFEGLLDREPVEGYGQGGFISTEDAFELVLELAERNVLSEEQAAGDEDLEDEKKRQELALEVVEDFLVNNIYD